VKCNEHPILIAEQPYNPKVNREKTITTLFEKFKVPATFLAKNPVLSSFSNSKSTALVVDSGGGVTCITPVLDGYALTQAIVKNNFAGEWINDEILKMLNSKNFKVYPDYMVSKKVGKDGKIQTTYQEFPNTTKSYYDFCVKVTFYERKILILKENN